MLIILVVLVLISVHITKLIHTIHDLRICISLCMCIYIYTSLFIHSFICLFVYLCVFQKKCSRSIAIIIVLYHYHSYPPVSQHIYTQPHSARPGAGAPWPPRVGVFEDNEVCPRLMWPFFRWGKWWKKNICTICIGRVGNIRWITIGELLLKDLGNADFI